MNFVVIDVESSNSARAICQIGIAKYENGILVDKWVSLINPEDTFEYYGYIEKHKIYPEDVINAPKFPEVVSTLSYYTKGLITVSHGSYDSDAIRKACNRYAIPPLDITWLDSTVAARRTWPEVSSKGYGLADLCERIGYQFNHHDALEDAKAAGAVLIALLKEYNQNIDTLMEIVNRPIKSKREKTSHSREGNPDGGLFGEVILFSDLSSEVKKRYSVLASQCGCNVVDGYSKKVTILVVPRLDVSENVKTGKYKKVEEGIAKGLNHQLLDENGFLKLIESATTEQ